MLGKYCEVLRDVWAVCSHFVETACLAASGTLWLPPPPPGGGGRPVQRVEEQGTWASRTRKHSEADYGRPVDRGAWTAKAVK